ncbi:hypothetical protein [Arthrobacter sp. NPDC057009]|uniref:hypothetical protein n=1 Tax=Arthrobacter sp. NPDC057009 TaxID=3345996 RepID=UPI0036344565
MNTFLGAASDVAGCTEWDIFCRGASDASRWSDGDLGTAIHDMAAAVAEATGQTLGALAAFWTQMSAAEAAVDQFKTALFLQDSLWYWTAILAVLSVVVGGIRTVWEHRGAPLRDTLRSLTTLTLVSGTSLAMFALLVAASGGFSGWIVHHATGGAGFSAGLKAVFRPPGEPLGTFMVILMGLATTVAGLLQIAFLVLRSAVLLLLAGILPTMAALTVTESGRLMFKRSLAWIFAFILYEPAAATAYALAFRLTDMNSGPASAAEEGSTDKAVVNSVTGLVLMIFALLALPALLRLSAPLAVATVDGWRRSDPRGAGSEAGGTAVAGGAVLRGFGGTPSLSAGTLNAGHPSGAEPTMRLPGGAKGAISGQGDVTALARGSSQPDGSRVQGANVPQGAPGAVHETDLEGTGVDPRGLTQPARYHGALEREINLRLAMAEHQRKPEKLQVTHKSGRGT